MRIAIGICTCLVALLGCASPKPAATTTSTTPVQLSERQRAEQLIDKSIESGEGIETTDGKTIVCKQESVTNTRLKNRKICLTADEWQARADKAKEGFKETLRAGEHLPPRGN